MTGIGDETSTVVLSDEEIVTQFCLQNKDNKTATNKLIKLGFTSLQALKLALRVQTHIVIRNKL